MGEIERVLWMLNQEFTNNHQGVANSGGAVVFGVLVKGCDYHRRGRLKNETSGPGATENLLFPVFSQQQMFQWVARKLLLLIDDRCVNKRLDIAARSGSTMWLSLGCSRGIFISGGS